MKWLTILIGLFLILIIVLADTDRLGALAVIYRIPFADKVGHFILYGVFSLVLNLTLFRTFPGQDRIWLVLVSGLSLGILIGLEEFSQKNFVNRTFSMADLGASYLGVIFFAWLAVKTKRKGINS